MRPVLEVKRLVPQAVLPSYQTKGAAGLDLVSISEVIIPSGAWAVVGTGLAIDIPSGYEAQVRTRSGLAARHGVFAVFGAVGTIDSDYRGEVKVILVNHGKEPYVVQAGDRIAQLVICPVARVLVAEVERLQETERGEGGFGSTGR